MRTRIASFLFLAIACITGCGLLSRPAEGPHEEQARLILLNTLDAWKEGTTDKLPDLTPPVRFQDDDHRAGWQLTKYEMIEPVPVIIPYQDVNVLLFLRDSQGKLVQKKATYQVGLDPITVQRSDN
jgi:hypothetical protein